MGCLPYGTKQAISDDLMLLAVPCTTDRAMTVKAWITLSLGVILANLLLAHKIITKISIVGHHHRKTRRKPVLPLVAS